MRETTAETVENVSVVFIFFVILTLASKPALHLSEETFLVRTLSSII